MKLVSIVHYILIFTIFCSSPHTEAAALKCASLFNTNTELSKNILDGVLSRTEVLIIPKNYEKSLRLIQKILKKNKISESEIDAFSIKLSSLILKGHNSKDSFYIKAKMSMLSKYGLMSMISFENNNARFLFIKNFKRKLSEIFNKQPEIIQNIMHLLQSITWSTPGVRLPSYEFIERWILYGSNDIMVRSVEKKLKNQKIFNYISNSITFVTLWFLVTGTYHFSKDFYEKANSIAADMNTELQDTNNSSKFYLVWRENFIEHNKREPTKEEIMIFEQLQLDIEVAESKI